jgi:plasmid stabilization system protein ParE
MMSGFRLSYLAERDLDEIADYIADRNPSAAVHELQKLLDKFTLLGTQPLLGEVRRDLPGKPRVLSCSSHLILYRPTTTGVEIARVIHSARDVASLLRQQK